MTCLNNLAKKFPILFALISFVLTFVLVQFCSSSFKFAALGQWSGAVMQLILSLFALAWALLFFKKNFFSASGGAIKYGFKKSIYLIIVFALMGIGGLAAALNSEAIGQTNVLLTFIICAVNFFCVGFFEEVTFRGFLMGGLLAKMGKSLKGVVWAIIISSFLFGFVHTTSYILKATTIDIGFIAQVIGKILSTGVFGAFLAVLYLRTRSLWPVIIIHALTDFLQSFGASLGGLTSGDYVVAGFGNTFSYLLELVLYIPLIVLAVLMLKDLKLPCTGPLYSNFIACTPVDTRRKDRKKAKLEEESSAKKDDSKASSETTGANKEANSETIGANEESNAETTSGNEETSNKSAGVSKKTE